MNGEGVAALHQFAGRLARRLTLLRALRAGFAGAGAVLALLTVATVATAVIPLTPVPATVAVPAAAAVLLIITVVTGLLRPVHRLSAVRALDVIAGLDERTSTALEVSGTEPATAMRARLLNDALAAAWRTDVRSVFPWRPSRSVWIAAACALVLAIWPSSLRGVAIPGTPAHRAQQVIRREGARLEQFARIAQPRTARGPETRRLASRMRDLGLRLQQERVDRAEALARIADLARQIEDSRREVESRIAANRPPQREQALPSPLFRRESVQQQIRQLRELTERLQQNPSTRDALQRLGDISRSGEAGQSPAVSQRLRRAKEQLSAGNIGGAGESLTEALRELEGLDAMLGDREGLQRAQQQLQRSQQTIAGNAAGPRNGEISEGESGPRMPSGPGERAPGRGSQAEAQPPEGPHEGTTPGTGRVTEKMGAPSQRLQGERRTDRLRGTQAEGPVSAADVLGVGRPGAVRAPVGRVPEAIVARVDRAMEANRTPGRYRALVRKYFELLAHLR